MIKLDNNSLTNYPENVSDKINTYFMQLVGALSIKNEYGEATENNCKSTLSKDGSHQWNLKSHTNEKKVVSYDDMKTILLSK